MRRVIFGGSFDPPTLAHEAMGRELAARFDEVVVVPAYVSPFKAGGADENAADRMAMLRLSFEGVKGVTLSDFEIASGGTSYSYLTAEHFAGEGIELYFAIGSDLLGGLAGWREPERLAAATAFYVVPRPYFPVDPSALEAARKIYRVEVAPFTGEEGSSALLKVARAFGKSREVVSEKVADYIESRGLYDDYTGLMSRFAELGMKPSRIEHTFRTAKAAILLAKIYGEDAGKAAKAAILHDIGKYAGPDILARYGIDPAAADYLPESCRHQVTGALLARKVFGEEDEDVLAAIATHCTGAEHMTRLQKIIFSADFIEEGRSFEGVEEPRKLCLTDLDAGVIKIMEVTLGYLGSEGKEIAPETRRAYEYLLKERNKL